MAALGAEVSGSWFLTSGVGFFILLILLSIFLTALCSNCRRRSFELRNHDEDRDPSSLINVVRLEETVGPRENPMINDIQKDEKENIKSITPSRNHLEAPQNQQDAQANGSAAVMEMNESETEEENSIHYTRWRSHLGAPQSQDVNSLKPSDPDHIYHNIEGRQSSIGDSDTTSSQTTNHELREETSAPSSSFDLSYQEQNLMYARVSKRVRSTPPPADADEDSQVEEEESPPSLPEREIRLEG